LLFLYPLPLAGEGGEPSKATTHTDDSWMNRASQNVDGGGY
jgi:hypothetical protein